MTLLSLFVSFLQVGLFSVGGGYAAIPLISQQVVTQHAWLTMDEFSNLVTIAEMTPGPIAINAATFVGMRIAGLGGACLATLGSILPSCILVSLLAWVYRRYTALPLLGHVLSCLRPAVVALIAAAGLSLLAHVAFPGGIFVLSAFEGISVLLFALAFLLLRLRKPSPILVLALCGVAGLVVGVLGGWG